jgi:hypothetical protein
MMTKTAGAKSGKAVIMIRSPFEVVILNSDLTRSFA